MFYFCFSLSWVSFLQKGERDRTLYIINLLKQYQVTALKHTYQQLPLVYSKECFALASAVKGLSYTGYFPVHWPDGYAKLMSPNKGEITVHGCHCPGDMVVRMRKVLAIPWSWYVYFSAFTWYCYHSFACLDCLFCRWCNSENPQARFRTCICGYEKGWESYLCSLVVTTFDHTSHWICLALRFAFGQVYNAYG